MLNLDQIMGFVRYALTLGTGTAIGAGLLSEDTAQLIIGIATATIPLVWTYIANSRKEKLKSVAAMDDVREVVVNSPKVAASIPSPKVISAAVANAGRMP